MWWKLQPHVWEGCSPMCGRVANHVLEVCSPMACASWWLISLMWPPTLMPPGGWSISCGTSMLKESTPPAGS